MKKGDVWGRKKGRKITSGGEWRWGEERRKEQRKGLEGGGRVRKEREKGDRRQDEEEKGGGRLRTEERRRGGDMSDSFLTCGIVPLGPRCRRTGTSLRRSFQCGRCRPPPDWWSRYRPAPSSSGTQTHTSVTTHSWLQRTLWGAQLELDQAFIVKGQICRMLLRGTKYQNWHKINQF